MAKSVLSEESKHEIKCCHQVFCIISLLHLVVYRGTFECWRGMLVAEQFS